ncbi:hypothetical protein, partial [uncultured Psychrobacillus sp.]|uniref:hypothetical protein n=1 Tax=uncultured Psychrobacillus sp. TaxID=1551585 RepID=UPI00262A7408
MLMTVLFLCYSRFASFRKVLVNLCKVLIRFRKVLPRLCKVFLRFRKVFTRLRKVLLLLLPGSPPSLQNSMKQEKRKRLSLPRQANGEKRGGSSSATANAFVCDE